MTIDEAIEHEREIAETHRFNSYNISGYVYEDDTVEIEAARNRCIECAKEHEQRASWFEELKAYREIGTVEECKNIVLDIEKAYNKGYADGSLSVTSEIRNKVIDDYMNKLCNHCMQQTNECYKLECPFCTDGCDIVGIAEQLKGGGVNEDIHKRCHNRHR